MKWHIIVSIYIFKDMKMNMTMEFYEYKMLLYSNEKIKAFNDKYFFVTNHYYH
jgi:hypothetical protein